jgi:transcriptional pleiotropic regulator of transition state genes
MKSTGVIRKLDELGRIVLPRELRIKLDLNEKDPMEIFIDGSMIVLKKYETSCIFCGGEDTIVQLNDKLICKKCMKKLKEVS